LLDDLLGGPAVSNLAYDETAPAVNADVLAAVIDGTHLPNGAYARSFARLARESNVARAQFLDISAGYAALGLIVALVGVAVVMVDRVRERQRQIATLRAFGVPAALVRRGVRIEAIVVALAGTATGIACGALFVWQLSRTHAIVAAARSFSVPVVPLIVGTVIVLMASAGATTTAARRVARLQLPRSLHVDQ
jgi:putative ABC transport system permease protein